MDRPLNAPKILKLNVCINTCTKCYISNIVSLSYFCINSPIYVLCHFILIHFCIFAFLYAFLLPYANEGGCHSTCHILVGQYQCTDPLVWGSRFCIISHVTFKLIPTFIFNRLGAFNGIIYLLSWVFFLFLSSAVVILHTWGIPFIGTSWEKLLHVL